MSLSVLQINELSNVPVPVMLMPDDFKAYSKIKVDNHLFNKYVSQQQSLACVSYLKDTGIRLKMAHSLTFFVCPLPLLCRENLPSRFKFKEYCPMVFRNLRERFGIDDQDYQVSDAFCVSSVSHKDSMRLQ